MYDFKIKQWQRVFGMQPFMCWVDPPSGYTTHYSLKKYNDGDDPGAAALNNDKDIIDDKIYSASLNNLTATAPISRSGENISLQYDSVNLKVTANKLSTIQNIGTTASPTFNDITVNDDIWMGLNTSDQAVLFVSGTIFARGDAGFIGNVFMTGSNYVQGNMYLTGSLKQVGNTEQTGSHYVSASLVTRKLIVNPKATGSGYIGSITASEEDYLQQEGLPPQYDILISGSSKITGNVVITGSLQVLGSFTLSTGSSIISTTEDGDSVLTFTAATAAFNDITASNIDIARSSVFRNGIQVIGTGSFNYAAGNNTLRIIPMNISSSVIYSKNNQCQITFTENSTTKGNLALYGGQGDVALELSSSGMLLSGEGAFFNVPSKGVQITGSLNVSNGITGSISLTSLTVPGTASLGGTLGTGHTITGSLNITGSGVYFDAPIYRRKLPHGTFIRSASFLFDGTNTGSIPFDNIGDVDQMSQSLALGRVYIQQSGSYAINVSAIGYTGTPAQYVELFLTVNSANVPLSNTRVQLASATTDTVIAVPFIYDFNAGDYFAIRGWASKNDTGFQGTDATAVSPSTTRPASPSIIVTAYKL